MTCIFLVSRYLYNFYSFLNYENEHYTEQWEWLEKELSIASAQGEKVLTILGIIDKVVLTSGAVTFLNCLKGILKCTMRGPDKLLVLISIGAIDRAHPPWAWGQLGRVWTALPQPYQEIQGYHHRTHLRPHPHGSL